MASVISVELTPNYEARKFRVDAPLGRRFPRAYESTEQAQDDAYAQKMFAVPGVGHLFFDLGFVTVVKTPDAQWNEVAEGVKAAIASVGSVEGGAATAVTADADDADLFGRIEEALNMHIRPHLANDGGGLELLSLQDYKLTIRYQGACGGCRSALTGTLYAIENCLQSYVDQRISVGIG